MPDWTRENRAIEQFGQRLREVDRCSVRVVERPDRDRRGLGGCDAILEISRRFAVEHTTIDSFARQREDDARFQRVTEPVKAAVKAAFPEEWIEISIPTGMIPTGTDWSKLTGDLAAACIAAIHGVPADDEPHRLDAPGLRFPVWVSRGSDLGGADCVLKRRAPEDQQAQLVDVIATRIREKKLRTSIYREQGLPVLLLLESVDRLLANRNTLARAFREAANREGVEEFDEVWLSTADHEPMWFLPLKLDDRIYPDLPDFRRYLRAQFELTYGSRPRP